MGGMSSTWDVGDLNFLCLTLQWVSEPRASQVTHLCIYPACTSSSIGGRAYREERQNRMEAVGQETNTPRAAPPAGTGMS